MRHGRNNDYGEGDLVGRLVMLLRAMVYYHVLSLRHHMAWRW